MALDTAILSYAFFESYLNRRVSNEWKGLIKLEEINPATFQNDTNVHPEIKQKISLCIDTIRNFKRANTTQEHIGFALELASKEKQELQGAAEKGSRYMGLASFFVNPDPLLAQVMRAVRSLVIAGIKDKPEYLAYLARVKKEFDVIKLPTALEKATAATRENALQREREKDSLARELEILNASNEFYKTFYDKWVKTDARGIALKEDSLEKCVENLKSKARGLPFCKKINPALANEKPDAPKVNPVPATAPAPAPVPKAEVKSAVEIKVQKVVEKPVIPVQELPKPQIMVKVKLPETKEPVAVVTSTPVVPRASYASKASALVSQSKFAEQPPTQMRERRQRHVKLDKDFVYSGF